GRRAAATDALPPRSRDHAADATAGPPPASPPAPPQPPPPRSAANVGARAPRPRPIVRRSARPRAARASRPAAGCANGAPPPPPADRRYHPPSVWEASWALLPLELFESFDELRPRARQLHPDGRQFDPCQRRDLFPRHPFDLEKDEYCSIFLGHPIESTMDQLGRLSPFERLERSRPRRDDAEAVGIAGEAEEAAK